MTALHAATPCATRPSSPSGGALGIFVGALALAGCAMGPNFLKPKPDVPSQWSATALGQSPTRAGSVNTEEPHAVDWWTSFRDPTLTSLVERSTQANLDVREAVLRIEEARAQRAQAAAAFWPSVSGNAGYSRQRLSLTTPNGAIFAVAPHIPGLPAGVTITNPYNQFQLGLSASWELDLFGSVRRSVEAADADMQSQIESAHDVLLSLSSDVAQTYIDLRGAQLRKSIVEQSLATERDVLQLTQQRWNAGLTTDLDVENAASEVRTTEAELPPLQREITQDINQLSELMSRPPDALRAELQQSQPVPPVPPAVPIGLPADLARRRPDIRRAEASLHAATARVGVATADLFPQLTLSVSGGFQSEGISKLIEVASRFATLAPTLEFPVFDGSRWATVRLQDVRAKEAAIDYARAVLQALQEVENALAAYASDQDRRLSLDAASEASGNALTLARQRYESGVTSFIEVLDAERTLQQNQLSLAEATTAVSTDLVALYKALGGGWENGSPSATRESSPASSPAGSSADR
jgi:outer membrane protein, multidrug efflux system